MTDKRSMDILKEDQDAVRSLTAVTQLRYSNLIDDISALNISPEEKSKLFKQTTGQLVAPDFKVNEELSIQFYNKHRENDLGESFDFDTLSEDGLSQEALSSHLAQVGGLVNEKGEAIWQKPELMAGLLLLIGGSLTKSFLTGRSENYVKIGRRDRSYRKRVRVPNARACSWCIRMALIDEHRMVFHRNCRCSIGVFFDGSSKSKYHDEVFEQYNADYHKVLGDLTKGGKTFTEDMILAQMRKEFGYR